MAAATGVSEATVRRIWPRETLGQPIPAQSRFNKGAERRCTM